ncbi:MAG: hypothetical protein EOP84_13435, partial [Verrucomicrobiaceae bacterium]
MKIPSLSLLAAFGLAFAFPAAAQQFKMQTPAGEAPGPWIFGTIGVGRNPDKTVQNTALKGLAIKVGEKGEAAVAYDLDLCRMVGAWTGGKFTTPMNLMSRGEYPTAMGDVAFTTGEVAGFQIAKGEGAPEWKDPRSEPFGPLPDVKFRGMYKNGDKVVLKWDVAGTEVLEMPTYEEKDGIRWFVRSFEVHPHAGELHLALGPGSGTVDQGGRSALKKPGYWSGLHVSKDGAVVFSRVVGSIDSFQYTYNGSHTGIALPATNQVTRFAVQVTADGEKFPTTSSILTEAEAQRLTASVSNITPDLGALTKGSPAQW